MQWDVASVFLTGNLIGLGMVAFSWSLAVGKPGALWFRDWAWGNGLMTVSVGLFLTQGTWHPWLSLVAANTILAGGIILVARGVERFAGRRVPVGFDQLSLALFVGLFALFAFVVPNFAARTALVTVVIVVALLRIVVVLARGLPEERKRHPVLLLLLTIAFSVLAASYAVRLGIVLIGGATSLFAPDLFVIATYLGTLMAQLLWTFGFTSLAMLRDQRLLEAAVDARERMLTLIAHDLRGPLAATADLLEYAQQDAHDPEETKLILKLAAESTRENAILVDNLLDWALATQGKTEIHREPLSVGPLLAEATAALIRQATAKNLTLLIPGDSNAVVHADARTLTTVVRNLVSNALKFTPAGGTVSIEVERRESTVVLRVKDTGPGLPPGVAETLQRDASLASTEGTAGEKGSGLGLSLCRAFVRANEGTLEYVSSPTGTEAIVTLPAAQ